MRVHVALCVTLLFGAATPVTPQGSQPSEASLVTRLSGPDDEVRHRAVEEARALGAAKSGRRLREALIAALEGENRIRARQRQAEKRGEPVEPHPAPEFYAAVARTVIGLHDSAAIPALIGTLGHGALVARALAEFGEQSAPLVLDVVDSTDPTMYEEVQDGLLSLRFMIETSRPLSPNTLGRIRRAVDRQLMNGAELKLVSFWRALDLAIVLNHPPLRRRVEQLATDLSAVEATGIKDIEFVEQTQKRANDLLAGVPPLPRP